jgi:hypothetical protein
MTEPIFDSTLTVYPSNTLHDRSGSLGKSLAVIVTQEINRFASPNPFR